MLEDMNVIDNAKYMRLYYQLDDALRNKGYLTLIASEYITRMSALFKTIGDSIIKEIKEMKIIILAKEGLVREILKEFNNECRSAVGELCYISQTRVKHEGMIVQVRSDVIWKLLNRILNTKIGGATKMYRNQTLLG